MVRPRESYDQRLIDTQLTITPEPAEVRWLHDVFGNAVAIATFDKRAKDLVIDSRVRLDHSPAELQNVDIERYARFYPFTYSSEDMPDLLRSIERQHHDPLRQIDSWARRFVAPGGQTDTLAMLSEMTAAIKREFTYVQRPEKGTQSPIETLARRKGTCRDYAMLMIEAVRALGFAARFVSGYVYNPTRRESRTAAAARMPGCASTFPARAGSSSIRPTASSAIAGSSASRSHAISTRRSLCPAPGAAFPAASST